MKLRLALPALVLALLVQNNVKSQNMKSFNQIFPQGEKLPEQFSQYFTGQAYLCPLSDSDALGTHISNVTFEPSCRNNWHSHTGGQLLICTAGRGYYQEKGSPARELRAGDIVEIPADAVHWHGAAPDSWFSHLAVECNSETNVNTWLEPVSDEEYLAATTSRHGIPAGRVQADAAAFAAADPDLAEIVCRFAGGDVAENCPLDLRTRLMVTLASTIAQNTPAEFRRLLPEALDSGVSPVEIKEIIYQSAAYTGLARTADFLAAANETLASRGVVLPLESQSQVTGDDRQAKGLALQKQIFGDGIERLYETAPEGQLHFQHFLSANCFGDYQTRTGLDAAQRELLTFAFLVSLGGCEPQVKAHVAGNAAVGNGKQVLVAATTQLLPYIGYPRTLNALACINEVLK